jgi:DNA-binding transcriptional regulator YbjK
VPTRQEVLLDSAIALLGTRGIRQLTHRAVDAAAGLPAGSTSNYFRTREALIAAIVDRFAERERAAWESVADLVRPSSADELAGALAAYLVRASGPERVVTLARYTLLVEAALQPHLQRQLRATAAGIREWGAHWLRVIGSRQPETDCQVILDQLDGILLHQLAFPEARFDPYSQIMTLVRALVAR